MNFNTQLILSFAVVFAAIIGLIRFHKVDKSYRPFIFLMWLSLINEVLSIAIIKWFKTNALNFNIYGLVESFLLLLLFKKWSGKKEQKSYIITGAILLLIWLLDNLIIHTIWMFNSGYIVMYSFIILFLSINQVNTLLFSETKGLFTNAKFLICVTFIIFYSYKATFEVFYVFDIKFSKGFYHNLFLILVFVNLFANLMYALATVWIPTKRKFTLPY